MGSSEEVEEPSSEHSDDGDPGWDPVARKAARQKLQKKRGRGGKQAALFSSDEDDDEDEDEGAGARGRRRGKPVREEEEESQGYSSGYSTGEEDSEGGENMFGEDALDPLTLLEDMEREAGEAGDVGAQQPYQVFRAQRRAVARSHRKASGSQEADSTENDDVSAEEGVGRQGRGSGPSKSGRGAFGAHFEDIIEDDDPLAAQLGLVNMGGQGRGRGKGPRGGKGKGTGRGRRRRKGPRKGALNVLPEEAARQLGHANLMYASGRYKEAVEMLMNVIKVFPNSAEPYHTLGLLHEALGNSRKALDFYMIAAHLTSKDITLWKRLAALSTESGFFRQAVYCLSKVLAQDIRDADARWDRAVLYAELGKHAKAIKQFEMMRPGDREAPKMLARLYHRAGEPLKAIAELEHHIKKNLDNFDMTDVNILAELYMQLGRFAETHALIMRARQAVKQLQQEKADAEAEQQAEEELLPMDLAVKDGLCLAHLGCHEEADAALAGLRTGEEVTAAYPDLTLDVGCALATMGQHARALDYLWRLLVVPEFGSDQAMLSRLLVCHRALGNLEPMVSLYKSRLEEMSVDNPNYWVMATTLAELFVETRRPGEAAPLMPKLGEVRLKLQEQAAASAAAAAATSQSLEQQHQQAPAQAQAEGKDVTDSRTVAMAAGPAAAADEAADEAAKAAATPAPMSLVMHKNKLALPQPPQPQQPAPAAYHSHTSSSQYAAHQAALAAGGSLTREQRVARYREKRKKRKFEKTIRYASRKAYAEVRPRIKGRFATEEEVLALKAQKQQQEQQQQLLQQMFQQRLEDFVVPNFA